MPQGGKMFAALAFGSLLSAGLAMAIANYDPQHRDRCLLLASMPLSGTWERATPDGLAELAALMSNVTVQDSLFPYGEGVIEQIPDCKEHGGLRTDGFEGMRWSPDRTLAVVFDGFSVPDALIGYGRGCLFRRYGREDWRIVGCSMTWVS